MAWNFTPTNAPTPLAINSLLHDDLSVITWVGWEGSRHPLAGGVSPVPGAQSGVSLVDIKGLMAPIKHLDKQGARQDGADWVDALWEVGELDLTVDVTGVDPASYRRAMRAWVDSWDTKQTGRLVWYSSQLGEWWLTLRLLKEPSDVIKAAPAMMNHQVLQWAARYDYPLWASFDSTSQQTATGATVLADPTGTTAPGFLPLWNRGDQGAWPVYLCQGPGTFTIGDNGVGTNVMTFGPLKAGQQARITTLPNRRTITDLQTGVNLYPLLTNRFASAIPAGAAVHVPVSVTGATAGVTSIQASLTPYRKWPE